jgi:plastocyanin
MRRVASVLIVGGLGIAIGGGVAQAASVSAEDFKFVPKTISVDPGEQITFTNSGSVDHEVSADDGSFATGNIAPGNSKSVTIDAPGTYGYYCAYHGSPGSGMFGTIRVGGGTGGAGGGAAPQTASPLPLIAVGGVLVLVVGLLLGRRRGPSTP